MVMCFIALKNSVKACVTYDAPCATNSCN